MKHILSAEISAILALLLLLQGCVTPQQRRRDYVEEHPALGEEVRKAILEGRVAKGMTGDDVLASWGDPERETVSYSKGGTTRIWTYQTPIDGFSSGVVILTITNGVLTGLTN